MNAKKVIKYGISDFIFTYKRHVSQKIKKGNCRILIYHAIENSEIKKDKMCLAVPPDIFRMHMKYLKEKGFLVIDLFEFSSSVRNNLPIQENSVVITFDDGFRTVFANALPILEEQSFPATLFVNISYAEKKVPKDLYWHDWETMSWDEIKIAHKRGLSIGSHAFTHARLTELDEERLKNEIVGSKRIIEKNIGDKIHTFCYPHGAFNSRVKQVIEDSGFQCACSGLEGINNRASDIFALKRTEITAFDDTPLRFEKKILGCCDWLGYLGVHR